ncbi:MAG: hypothetical protein Q7T57_04980 [Dehalococcoidales bacterium]|nr:hypothetical protein [Dehalococcoidales bacterium]
MNIHRISLPVICCLMVVSLMLISCGKAPSTATSKTTTTPTTTSTSNAADFDAAAASAAAEDYAVQARAALLASQDAENAAGVGKQENLMVFTFEQKRNDVMTYIRSFNSITNSFGETSSVISFPSSTNTDLKAWTTSVTNLLTAYDGAISRLEELTPLSFEPLARPTYQETIYNHLYLAKATYQERKAHMKAMWDIIARGELGVGSMGGIIAEASKTSSLNRATEQLMLQYNISDSEVSYRFRGK